MSNAGSESVLPPGRELIEISDRIWYMVSGESRTGFIVLHDYWGIRNQLIMGIESLRLEEHTILIPDLFAFQDNDDSLELQVRAPPRRPPSPT